jgi:hypothetical protein
MQRAAHLDHHRYTAAQVIVSAHAYGSAKLLHHLKHAGTLPGLSDQLGKRARTNSEQLISITRPYGEWRRDPDRIHVTPNSVAITSGVWPDDQTSIEPVGYGVGSDLMAFALTYHQHGAQKHPVEGWLEALVEHPWQVLDKIDARHWSERQVVMLCMQTSDTSIDLAGRNAAQPSRQWPAAAHSHTGGRGVRGSARAEDARRTGSLVVRGAQPHSVGSLQPCTSRLGSRQSRSGTTGTCSNAMTPTLTGPQVLATLIGYVVVYAFIFVFSARYIYRLLREGPTLADATPATATGHRPMAAAGPAMTTTGHVAPES